MTKPVHKLLQPSRRALLLGSASALAMPAVMTSARAQPKSVFKIAHSEAIGSPLTNAFEKWAKTINEKSGGRIDAQHFPASQLGSLTQLLEASNKQNAFEA